MNTPYNKLFQCSCDIFHQGTFEKIGGQNSKSRTYALFEKAQGYEEYLTKIKDVVVPENVEHESQFSFYCPTYRFQRSAYLTPNTGGIHDFDMLPDDKMLELLFLSYGERYLQFCL